ncbi:antitoxin family protein [Nostoc sp. 2RC]|uniref:antitoxin family protein n=1 Tax=Nostoc sp. 2RC TaxID=2485484 RepID=UPI0016241CCE|nr:antitoxin family protein [Nostoc sp. 2RC]MBC1235783.1 antitoxin family protein [Nostoc sp. 2RC]
MVEKITAIFNGKVFYPSEPIVLPTNTRVRISIEILPPSEDETVSFLQTAPSLSLQGPSDWSANIDKYLYAK